MPTVSGKWKWNDTLPLPSSMIAQKINFTSGENGALSGIAIANSGGQTSMLYTPIEYTIYNSGSNLWFNEDCKTMDFGSTEQEVSEEFYNYLTANATKQEEPAVPTTTKTVSSDNLARFKQKCDETYAAIGNIPTVSTELVNLGTLSTSGTLTTDQVTQIGTTTIGVTARASVNGVTRFYERVNISGTTATLVSADDDALHVLTVNLSTRAYTLSDVALGGGGPEIPTPTTSDNGKVLGVANGEYALQEAGGGDILYVHHLDIRLRNSSENISYFCYVDFWDYNGDIITIDNVANRLSGYFSCSGYANSSGKTVALPFQIQISPARVQKYILEESTISTDANVTLQAIYDSVIQI